MNTGIDKLIKVLAITVLVLSMAVSIPLTIDTWKEGGGPWGFGVVGLPVLIPLSAYLLFGIAGLAKQDVRQREYFIGAHVITLVTGLVSIYLFPVYPVVIVVIPVFLATLGIVNKRHFKFYLLLMIILAVVANIVLLKWELEFGRTIPFLQLFESGENLEP